MNKEREWIKKENEEWKRMKNERELTKRMNKERQRKRIIKETEISKKEKYQIKRNMKRKKVNQRGDNFFLKKTLHVRIPNNRKSINFK